MAITNIDALVQEYREKPLPPFIARDDVIRALPSPQRFNMVEIITGMRRSGKTFYLFQLIRRVLDEGFPADRILYFNFSDDRLAPMGSAVMDDVLEAFWRQVPEARIRGAYLFFDEVQEAEQWQGFCQRVSENENVTLVVTGSSSKLSSEEIATTFRGRSHAHEMLPLSFSEYCRFHDIPDAVLGAGTYSSGMQTQLEGLFERYLVEGGFPGIQGRPAEDRIELLQSYVRDVVARDVAERFGRQDIRLANRFALYGLRNTACEFSINGLTETLKEQGFKIYWDKADRLMGMLIQAYLFFKMEEYATSLKAGSTALPKVYAVDPGIVHAVSRANQQDIGKRFETAVYLELRRRMAGRRTDTLTSFALPGAAGRKVDFMVGDALEERPYSLIQATVDMGAEKTRKREITSLVEAMVAVGLDKGTVITLREEGMEKTPAGIIEIVPAWKWCLTKDL